MATYGRFSGRQANPMDFARKAGRDKKIAEVLQNLKLQQAELPGEMAEYGTKKSVSDIGSSLLSNVLINMIPGAAPANILNSIFSIGAKGAGKSILGGGIGNIFEGLFNIKPPKAPTVDMSELSGPGMSDARQTIKDALEVSDVGYEGAISDLGSQSKIINLLMSLGPGLKEDIPGLGGKEGGMSIFDWLKGQIGLGQSGKGPGRTFLSSIGKDYFLNK